VSTVVKIKTVKYRNILTLCVWDEGYFKLQ